MKINPFARFRGMGGTKRASPEPKPLPGELEAGELTRAYLGIASREFRRTTWLADLERVREVYRAAEKAVKNIPFSPVDMEEVLYRIEAAEAPLLPGVAGLFISAMVNLSPEPEFRLNLLDLGLKPGFLGYRLAGGKKIEVEGSLGDFTGAFMDGGEIVVSGDAGNYTGCSMTSGSIEVMGSAGLFTGDWMRGGEIAVQGDIAGQGEILGGSVRVGKNSD